MTRRVPTQRALPLALTALTAMPLASAWTPSLVWAAKAAKSQTFKGPIEYVPHGSVQVSIVVKSRKITGVKVANSPEDPRSVFIQSQAIPTLKRETLRAQSARISAVSGATDTSDGYIASLQAAIKAARRNKALK